MTIIRITLVVTTILALFSSSFAQPTNSATKKTLVYKMEIVREIDPAAWRIVKSGLNEAVTLKADLILIRMNTYGGLVNVADSIRTKILNCKIPIWVFIDNQAASAGALISIACDRIYMRQGASIGAATVVDQTGAAMPDKYQSFMRSMMRATAESHGKDTLFNGKDSIFKWRRDPLIAEAMVDPRTIIPGLIDSTKVLTFTTQEAIKYGYCEGEAESVSEVLSLGKISNYEIREQHISALEKAIGFLLNPLVQGILIMLIFAGIYFELQTPGIGFPLVLALSAAVVYFAPLYMEGLAENWELSLFFIGLILIAVEVFAIPGFGVIGIAGITFTFLGLTLSMIDNEIFRQEGPIPTILIVQPVLIVALSMFLSLIMAITLSQKLFTDKRSPLYRLALHTSLKGEDGFVGIDLNQKNMIGKNGITLTMLRPAGKVTINEEIFDAISTDGVIDKDQPVFVKKDEAGQLYVSKV
ncbi:NfeD family protein [Williamwhitmania taraxaci]|uniref:Membrane-bound serine protease (ClpP class) n=1 Tax=Williamwhitmania taraxaci TaxID=1640674 RepID=A0A1G6RMX7_9BACT|nr:NfeD family protein [Williamwhitmania taraxaci]SDD05704.1 membrane-bound serine protease (ClpP class) [Williamwhitmania taraxaci]